MYRIVIVGELRDEAAINLIQAGALGSAEMRTGETTIYFDSEGLPVWVQPILDRYRCHLIDAQWFERGIDYVAESQTRWFPLNFPKLTVIPVLDHEQESDGEHSSRILIQPGLGFGTGHHPTTRMLIEMFHSCVCSSPHPRIWDVGTGSGILAIALLKLFGGIAEAWENDSDAVQNALLNFTLNRLSDRVHVHSTPFPNGTSGQADLIAANLYSQLHYEFEPSFRSALKDSGSLFISGILLEELFELLRYFTSRNWERERLCHLGGWAAVLFRKREL